MTRHSICSAFAAACFLFGSAKSSEFCELTQSNHNSAGGSASSRLPVSIQPCATAGFHLHDIALHSTVQVTATVRGGTRLLVERTHVTVERGFQLLGGGNPGSGLAAALVFQHPIIGDVIIRSSTFKLLYTEYYPVANTESLLPSVAYPRKVGPRLSCIHIGAVNPLDPQQTRHAVEENSTIEIVDSSITLEASLAAGTATEPADDTTAAGGHIVTNVADFAAFASRFEIESNVSAAMDFVQASRSDFPVFASGPAAVAKLRIADRREMAALRIASSLRGRLRIRKSTVSAVASSTAWPVPIGHHEALQYAGRVSAVGSSTTSFEVSPPTKQRALVWNVLPATVSAIRLDELAAGSVVVEVSAAGRAPAPPANGEDSAANSSAASDAATAPPAGAAKSKTSLGEVLVSLSDCVVRAIVRQDQTPPFLSPERAHIPDLSSDSLTKVGETVYFHQFPEWFYERFYSGYTEEAAAGLPAPQRSGAALSLTAAHLSSYFGSPLGATAAKEAGGTGFYLWTKPLRERLSFRDHAAPVLEWLVPRSVSVALNVTFKAGETVTVKQNEAAATKEGAEAAKALQGSEISIDPSRLIAIEGESDVISECAHGALERSGAPRGAQPTSSSSAAAEGTCGRFAAGSSDEARMSEVNRSLWSLYSSAHYWHCAAAAGVWVDDRGYFAAFKGVASGKATADGPARSTPVADVSPRRFHSSRNLTTVASLSLPFYHSLERGMLPTTVGTPALPLSLTETSGFVADTLGAESSAAAFPVALPTWDANRDEPLEPYPIATKDSFSFAFLLGRRGATYLTGGSVYGVPSSNRVISTIERSHAALCLGSAADQRRAASTAEAASTSRRATSGRAPPSCYRSTPPAIMPPADGVTEDERCAGAETRTVRPRSLTLSPGSGGGVAGSAPPSRGGGTKVTGAAIAAYVLVGLLCLACLIVPTIVAYVILRRCEAEEDDLAAAQAKDSHADADVGVGPDCNLSPSSADAAAEALVPPPDGEC